MGDVLKEKYLKLCVKLLSVHRDYMVDNKEGVKSIKRTIKSGKEIRVNASLYNKVLMMITYAQMIFRYTTSLDALSEYNDNIKEANKSIKELYKEIKDYDEFPNEVAVYVRCSKDKIRNIIKHIERIIHDLDNIIKEMDQEFAITQSNYKILTKLTKIYTLRVNAINALVYSIQVMFKYKE